MGGFRYQPRRFLSSSTSCTRDSIFARYICSLAYSRRGFAGDELYSNGNDYFKYYHGYGEDGKVPEEDSETQYYLRYTGQYKNGQLAKWDATWRTTYGNESCGQVIVKYDENIDLEVPESFKKDYVVG